MRKKKHREHKKNKTLKNKMEEKNKLKYTEYKNKTMKNKMERKRRQNLYIYRDTKNR